MTVKPQKAEKLIEYIASKLVSGEYHVGTRLPSIRRFAGKFKLSYGSVYRGIDYLCDQGLLEKRPNSGVFVKGYRNNVKSETARRIAVFMESYVAEFHCGMCYSAFLGMQDKAFKNGFNFTVNQLEVENVSNEKIIELSENADAIIFLNEYDWYLKQLELPIPVVGVLNQNSFDSKISTINVDPFSAAEQVVNYFKDQNIRRVNILSSPKPIFMTRAKVFSMLWDDAGGESTFMDCPPEQAEFNSEEGYFFTSDQWVQNASLAFQEKHGCPLGTKHVVIGIDGKRFIDPDFHQFPTIAVDWKAIGETAFDECLRLIEDPTGLPQNITINGRLVLPHITN